MAKFPFTGRVIILGFGQVARCLADILEENLSGISEVLVLDRVPANEIAPEISHKGWAYKEVDLTRDNIKVELQSVASRGDLLINVTAGVCSASAIEVTTEIGCLYVDTSIEPWEDQYDGSQWPAEEQGSFGFLCRVRDRVGHLREGWPTSIVAHGANPGLVNHFVKHGLSILSEKRGFGTPDQHGDSKSWAELCQRLDVPVIQISEQDTQKPKEPRKKGLFLNTWSVEAFWAESMCPGEAGWGTHEKEMPANGLQYTYGRQSGAWFDGHASDLRLRSWAPDAGEFVGAAIPHPECLTLTEYLTIEDNQERVFAPTVVFVYKASPPAEESLAESIANDWKLQTDQRVMTEEIATGIDELGVLIIPRDPPAIWVGSQLSIEGSRAFAPKSNATVLQVAAGVLAACRWAVENTDKGYLEPEDLPHNYVLDFVKPYIAPFVEVETDWPYRTGISEGKDGLCFERFYAVNV